MILACRRPPLIATRSLAVEALERAAFWPGGRIELPRCGRCRACWVYLPAQVVRVAWSWWRAHKVAVAVCTVGVGPLVVFLGARWVLGDG